MAYIRSSMYVCLLVLCCILGCFRNVNSTEFVPVLMWESSSKSHTQKDVPALATVNGDEFKDIVLQKLQNKPVIILFAEENLSVEDFSWQDEAGEGAFPNLEKVSRTSGALTYLPFVHAPLHAFRYHVPIEGQEWYHLNIEPDGLVNDAAAMNATLLFLNLDDAASNEDRPDLLKRHDAIISQFYNTAVENRGNVLAVYTAHHSSWQSGEETLTRRVRHLLATPEEEEAGQYRTNTVLLYATNMTLETPGNKSYTLSTTPVVSGEEDITLNFTINNEFVILEFGFSQTLSGYWSLERVNVTAGSEDFYLTPKQIEAPLSFSYHCNLGVVINGSDGASLQIEKFQIQPYVEDSTFGSAYDCVYFFTVPIWSGVFVCIIFSLIMAFGLCMIMDIKTMDRFDDPKGKTITINTAE